MLAFLSGLVPWVLAFIGFASLVVLHEAGHFAAAKAVGMRVERFALFFPPLIFRKQIGETEYAIGAVPLGGYVRISGMSPAEDLPEDVRDRAYHAQPVWKRIVVIAAGPLVNLVIGVVLLIAFLWLIGPPTAISDRVDEVVPGSPAAGVIEPGDRLVSVDGVRWSPQTLSAVIDGHRCPLAVPLQNCRAAEPAELVIERADGSRKEIELTPTYDAVTERNRVGFRYGLDREPIAFGPAVIRGLDASVRLARLTVELPARLFDPVQRAQITGVVGSYETTRQAIIKAPGDVVFILAVISLSLAIINLFPFLPLDGGHIFWAIVEKIRHKPVPLATMERAGVIGIMLLIPLFMIGFYNDVGRLMGEGFSLR